MMSDGCNTKYSDINNFDNVDDDDDIVMSPMIKTPSEEIDKSASTVTTVDEDEPDTLKCIEDFKNELSPTHTSYSSDENEETNSHSENTLMFDITEKDDAVGVQESKATDLEWLLKSVDGIQTLSLIDPPSLMLEGLPSMTSSTLGQKLEEKSNTIKAPYQVTKTSDKVPHLLVNFLLNPYLILKLKA